MNIPDKKIPDSILLENISCPLGCTQDDKDVVTSRDYLHGFSGEFMAVQCKQCGLIRTNPRVTSNTIGLYYPDDYGPYVGTRVDPIKSKKSFNIKQLLKRFIDLKSQSLPPLKLGRLLEIGCASGAYLHEMAEKGWEVQGIEFSEKASESAKKLGYDVFTGSLEEAPAPKEPFDLIVGWMVLEHLHDPVKCLKKLRAWAKPDTVLALSIPNAGSLEFKVFKDKWYALQLPTHLHHFTPDTLEKVLLVAGWKLKKVHHQRIINNIIVSTGYVLQGKGYTGIGKKFIDFHKYTGHWVHVLYPLAWLLSLVGQTGRMTIWATPIINQKDEK